MIRVIGPGLALLAGMSGGSGIAMTDPATAAIGCSVEQAEKLPAQLSAESLCSAVRGAAAAALDHAGLPPSALLVRIKVDSDRKLSAVATLNGKSLPEQHVGVSDHGLNRRAALMLATAVAAGVASAAR